MNPRIIWANNLYRVVEVMSDGKTNYIPEYNAGANAMNEINWGPATWYDFPMDEFISYLLATF